MELKKFETKIFWENKDNIPPLENNNLSKEEQLSKANKALQKKMEKELKHSVNKEKTKKKISKI